MEKAKQTALVNYQQFLNQDPPQDEIITGKQRGPKKELEYIPIGILEQKMDDIFFGAWKTQNCEWKVIANEICVSLEVHFFHPKQEIWLCRVGVGAAQIRQIGKSKVTDFDAKIKNALEMDFPHAKANAFKNAVQSIGRIFGRDLMREVITQVEDLGEKQIKSAKDALKAINEAGTIDQMVSIYKDDKYKLAFLDKDIITAFVERRKLLEQKMIDNA